jgi:hypothetical protein
MLVKLSTSVTQNPKVARNMEAKAGVGEMCFVKDMQLQDDG